MVLAKYRLTATLDSSLSAPDDLNTHADNPPTTLAWQAAEPGFIMRVVGTPEGVRQARLGGVTESPP